MGLSFLDFGWVLVLLIILGGVGFTWLIFKDQPRLESESLSAEQIELVTGSAVNLNDRIYRSLAEYEIAESEVLTLDQEPKVEEPIEQFIREEPIEEVIEAELHDEDTELIDEEDEAETEAIIKEPTEEEINPEEEIEMAIRSQWLENFIGHGFKAKMQGKFEEAILFFSKARTLCTEPKLDMLLTLELSIAYREQGRYFEAIEVLRHYIANQVKGISETFYKEVRNQIIYLEIIQYELNTLGMPNLPYNEIPRLNKVKIEEIFISLKL
ncbi:MAG: hypothetical protein GX295_01285 [Syntrophomonadaceae bacterium]|nr:hypothetical protein [Syntrophomonadaceae bacterium]